MNWDRIKGNWTQFRGHVMQQWGRLTDDDLDIIDGQRQVLSGRIQETYGISKDEAERQIRSFEQSLKDDAARPDRRTGDTHAPGR